MESPVTVLPVSEWMDSIKANAKNLNTPMGNLERIAIGAALSFATAGLTKIGVFKDPSMTQRAIIKLGFAPKAEKRLKAYKKSALLAGLLLFTTVFELKNDTAFKTTEKIKNVLFGELIAMGFDFMDIETMILGASKDIETALEA